MTTRVHRESNADGDVYEHESDDLLPTGELLGVVRSPAQAASCAGQSAPLAMVGSDGGTPIDADGEPAAVVLFVALALMIVAGLAMFGLGVFVGMHVGV